jgi:hypothetical protein
MRQVVVLALLLALAGSGCDRNLEPFDPNEQPVQPDLSRIFPEGAERAARVEPGLPASPGGRGAPSMAAEVAAADEGAALEGTVRLGDGQVAPPGSVLFIVARAHGGTAGPPTAVKRVPDASFPLSFRIGPEDRMIQAMPFTGPFNLSARLDSDGDAATRTPGDLQGAIAAPVPAGTTGIELVLDQAS